VFLIQAQSTHGKNCAEFPSIIATFDKNQMITRGHSRPTGSFIPSGSCWKCEALELSNFQGVIAILKFFNSRGLLQI